MKNFKEWLSDYLRYIMLLLAAVLVFFLVMIGVRVYQNRGQQKQDVVEVYPATEALSESETPEEKLSESETESEKLSESESESESAKQTESEKETEESTEPITGVTIVRQSETERKTTPTQKTQTGSKTTPVAQPVTQTERQTETEPPTETETDPPESVYMTLTGSCYLRSGPGYEYEIIGEYMYGTTVQVLDDSTGWYKVQVDGMTGYMGGRFFH